MKIIKIDLENFSKEEVDVVAGEILKGEVVVLPTDTVYGLSTIVTSKKAIRKIYKIKKRTPKQQKHLILLVKSFCMVRNYCFLSAKQHSYLKERWVEGNKALTVILRGRRDYFRERNIDLFELISEDDCVAVRRPDNKFLLELIKAVGEPIVSTSLNITGEAELKDVSRIDKYFKEANPDVIVDVGELPKQKPSRLEDLRDMKIIKVYRE
jgi:L-threonylcarbamoyladenylate synthase